MKSQKQETMLEEMVVEHLTEEEKERIRDIRFTITFGTDEVEIKPQMQDIEAVEPFVVKVFSEPWFSLLPLPPLFT